MTLKHLHERGLGHAAIAQTLGVTEGAIRYHLRHSAAGATDGRAQQPHKAAAYRAAIEAWLAAHAGASGPVNLAALHDWLVEEHDYPGSLRSLQRYFRAAFPKPRRRARRRVETPPGAQAQVDWAHFPRVWVGGDQIDLLALHLQLNHSRHAATIWSTSKDQLAWQHAHNGALLRIDGVPATMRVDNEKTAVASGAGAWGTLNASYSRYAEEVGFHVDPCPPRAPQAKGKVERNIRDGRFHGDPRRRHWDSLEELQEWSDGRSLERAHARVCPATGTSVYAAWQAEKAFLRPLPVLPEPFDLVLTRTVRPDCTVSFEGRSYSVPFRFVGRPLEVRGCAGRVQMVADGGIVATWRRGTPERILIDPQHFEGEPTAEVLPPGPLGRMGRRLQEIAELEPERRPLDLYAALAEVAR